MGYDEIYRTSGEVFGTQPDEILKEYCFRIDRLRPVLDVGTGQGRNALFLAREGFVVDAIDPSRVAIDQVLEAARRANLTLRTRVCGFESFAPKVPYSGIVLAGLIPEVSRTAIGLLLERTESWSTEGTVLFVTAFTIDDPAFPGHRAQWNPIGENSFQSGEGQVRTYLRSGELLGFFHRWEVIHYWEGMGPEHRHGESPPECHARVEGVFRRGFPERKPELLAAAEEKLPHVGT